MVVVSVFFGKFDVYVVDVDVVEEVVAPFLEHFG